jgi:type I restriction-modification system DNA methylase subunit/predicted type IV restriction endonuclease
MPAPAEIRKLVERFEANLDTYRGGGYNETLLRRDFLDPFFKALGWDIDNSQDYAEAFREVIHEDAIKVGGSTKAPDYSFRIGGRRIFFLEAKKPSVFIKEEVAPAYQLRRYAWSANLPLSILSDFEEFAVYDTRIKPSPADKPAKGRILYLTFRDYLERWDEIAAVFSKEAIQKGAFDKYAQSAKGKRGTATVDAEFLAQIEQWRDLLAKNLALRNPGIGVRELNFAVQATIDRIVFLRICEDRGIEPLNRLQGLANGARIYERLAQVFREADDRYNSGLFHFKSEKNRPGSPDEFTLDLKIDDKLLKDLLNGLYYPESPYEFSVLPADILGQVYERFLGSVIRLTAGGQAKVEEKPEVKKAGGVYYTPTYIVDYIVRQTVGRLVESQSPKDAAKLKILDPACGSGSFLIGAYQHLLDWHLKWYADNDPEKHAKGKEARLYRAKEGWRLTASERKRILVNNIYGVDIDAQAVEVTKLSLLLKVLEGETDESLNAQMKLFHERALPDLDGNIKCGNSLIGPDFFDGRLDLDEDERRRINAFDWQAEFPQVFHPSPVRGRGAGGEGRGGFDAVIGNPPYSYRNATEELLRPYYLERYLSAEGNFDLYKFFVERALGLCRLKGMIGMIVSASFLVQPSFTRLRKYLLEHSSIKQINPLGPNAFVDATVDTAILIAEKVEKDRGNVIEVRAPTEAKQLVTTSSYSVSQDRFWENDHLVFDYKLSEAGNTLIGRLFKNFPNIEQGFDFGVGINTGFIRSKLVAEKKLDSRYHPMVAGSGISRYGEVITSGWIMYDRDFVRDQGTLGRSLPPERFFSEDKILVVRTRNLSLSRRIVATVDSAGTYNLNRLSNIIAKPGYSLIGLLGILNSNLLNWIYSTRFFDYEIKPIYLRVSPLADVNDVKLNHLAGRMLQLHHDLAAAKTAHDKTLVERQIAATDRQIDRLVYELYGLTEEEIAVVEGGA